MSINLCINKFIFSDFCNIYKRFILNLLLMFILIVWDIFWKFENIRDIFNSDKGEINNIELMGSMDG